jgi:hypothetical protein
MCALSMCYSLDVEDGVDGVHGGLVLGGLTDQTLLSGEGDERRGGEGTLVVGDWRRHCQRIVAGTARIGFTY